MQHYKILSRKHDGTRHRSWDLAYFLSHPPLRLSIPAGTLVRNMDGTEWCSDYEVEAYFHPNFWFNVFTLKKGSGTEWYCNLATPPEIDEEAGEIRFIDYDLDVYVYADRRHKVLDQAEFEHHAQLWGYSAEVRRNVEEGLQALLEMIRQRQGPFI